MSEATDCWSTKEQSCTPSALTAVATPTPPVTRPLDWTVEDVQKFLAALGLSDLQLAFRDHEVSGLVLLTLSERDLEYSLGVRKFGHRRRLALAIAELQQRVMTATKKSQAIHPTDSFNVMGEPSSVASTGSVSSRPPSPGPRSRSASPAPPSRTPEYGDNPRRPTALRPLDKSPKEASQVTLQSPNHVWGASSATLPPSARPGLSGNFSIDVHCATSPRARLCGPDAIPMVPMPRQGSRTPHLAASHSRAGSPLPSPLPRHSPQPVRAMDSRAMSPRRRPEPVIMPVAPDGWVSPKQSTATAQHMFVPPQAVPRPPTPSACPQREKSLPTRIHSSPRRGAGIVAPQVSAMPVAPMHPGEELWQFRTAPIVESGPGVFRPVPDSRPRMLPSGTSRRSRSSGPPGVYCGIGSLAAPTPAGSRDMQGRLH